MKPVIKKATKDDIDSIYKIIKPYSDAEIILDRTKDDIYNSIKHFLTAKIDNRVIGVISLYDYGNKLKEIRSLAVTKEFYENGIGSALLKALINDILNKGNVKIFVLTYSPVFFKKNGFVEVSKESLPLKIWKDCNKCKNRENCGETALIYSK